MENHLTDRLRVMLAQLNKLPYQIEQELETILAAHVVSPATSEATLAPSGDVIKAEAELTELWQQIEKAKSELNSLTAKNEELGSGLSQCEDAIAKADLQHKQLIAENEAAKAQLQRASEAQRQIELQQAQYQEVVDRAQALQAELHAREQAILTAESSLNEREKRITDRTARLEGTRYWLESLLPTWLQEESIAPWRDALLEDAQHPSVSSTSAGLLFATLSLYTYAQRDNDVRAVADALRDVGRRLFAWLKERNYGDYDASMIAQSLAEQINRECSGRCEIEVPVPGSPAQNQTMLYQPRPGVSAQSVIAVQSWCVRGAKREVIHRAAVTV